MSEITKEEKKQLNEFEKKFGYKFKTLSWLKKALTHKSYANERKLAAQLQNERLEFLGDAVLELAISELLMTKFPEYSEGQLSKLRASIVNEKQLADLARKFELGQNLFLGRGEEQTSGREKSSLLADAYEAILGAIYLDRGFKKASDVVKQHYHDLFDNTPAHAFYKDYKTELQERCQSLFRSVPRYRLVAEKGPDHDKIFAVDLMIRHEIMGQGEGRSKKQAEQEAAKQALVALAKAGQELVKALGE